MNEEQKRDFNIAELYYLTLAWSAAEPGKGNAHQALIAKLDDLINALNAEIATLRHAPGEPRVKGRGRCPLNCPRPCG